ncbi:hypothetical protein [Sulfurimonas sp.]
MLKKYYILLILMNSILLSADQCKFPPQWNIKNFTFKTHGYTPEQYLLEEDTYGLVGNGSLPVPIRNELENTDFPFEALNIIAACGNSDAMVELSTKYEDDNIKNYWLQRAKNKGNAQAAFLYGFTNDFNMKKARESQANTLLKFYKDRTKKDILRDMALAQLFYLYAHTKVKAKMVITEDMIKYPQYSVSYIAQQHGYDYYTDIQDELSQSFIIWLKEMSKKGSPEASLKLAEYYSLRDYKQTLKYIDEYIYNKQDLEDILYPKYKKTNDGYVYRQSRFQIINNIWHDLDENIQQLNKELSKKEKEKFQKSLAKFQQNIKVHKQYLRDVFPNETLESIALMDLKTKLNLLSTNSTPLNAKEKQYIYDIISTPINPKATNKNTLLKNQKETKILFDSLSNQSQQSLYVMSYELLKNNPKTYKSKFGIMQTKKRYEIKLKRAIQSLTYVEYGALRSSIYPISKQLEKFPKKKYSLILPKEVALIAKKIDILTFSKDYLAQKDKYFTPKKVKEKRLKQATLYWLEYVVKNITDYTKYKKYYTEANYRLAQTYDKNLKDKNLGNEYSQEKVFMYLNNIALAIEDEKPFSNYQNKNYSNDIALYTLYLKEAINLASLHHHILSDYINIPDLNEKRKIYDELVTYKMMFSKNNTSNDLDPFQVLKEQLQKTKKLYLKEAKTSLDWYTKYEILRSSLLFRKSISLKNNSKLKFIGKRDALIIKIRNNVIKNDLENKNELLKKYKEHALVLNNIRLRNNIPIQYTMESAEHPDVYTPYVGNIILNELIWYRVLLFAGFVDVLKAKHNIRD